MKRRGFGIILFYFILQMFKTYLKPYYNLLHTSIRTKSSQSTDVLFNTHNNAGMIVLNRPKDLNCLTTSMVLKIIPQLREWETKQSLIITKGAGDKAFCAGGDVKLCVHKVNGPNFFWHEYNLIHFISIYRIPYISLNDRYTMGGGLGISMPGTFRVATERTQMAMPENKIGLCPDVGGTYFLPRLKSNIGIYLGLTGDVIKGYDTVQVSLATHYVPSERLNELESKLLMCNDVTQVSGVLSKFNEETDCFSMAPYVKDIEYCFSAPTLAKILKRLEKVNNKWSAATLDTLHKICPGSLAVTFRALQAGAKMNLKDCLKMEYRLTCHATQNHDFPEGVRAKLLDKDNNPKWIPKNLSEVTDEYVEGFFMNKPPRNELDLTIM